MGRVQANKLFRILGLVGLVQCFWLIYLNLQKMGMRYRQKAVASQETDSLPDDNMKNAITCNVCMDRKFPVCLPCGHLFCYECIVQHASSTDAPPDEGLCPQCRFTFPLCKIAPMRKQPLCHAKMLRYAIRLCRSQHTHSRTYVSGIQPTGSPHIGNYFGFIQKWVEIQEKEFADRKFLGVVDLHSITTGLPDPDELRDNTLKMAAGLLACGVNPHKTVLFQQSRVPEHTQLFWILSSLQTVAQLKRMPQFKDKSKRYKKGDVPVGLLSYPVLQTADVFIYKGTHVPVGEDQKQHLTLMRDLVTSFNGRFNNYFPVPELVTSNTPRLKSLRDSSQKMSKSEPNPMSRIEIGDSAEEMRIKVRKALTDSIPTISYEPEERPAISNLVLIYSALANIEPKAVVVECKGMDTLAFKERLFELAEAKLGHIRDEYERLLEDSGYVRQTLADGSRQASEVAKETLSDVRRLVGLD
ncbi:tryptophanyl-tRNA synthetase [Aphelenchoides avenae]|nr:tryptophanyl-tRNA synthetase [Aphelenchus avenae]